MLSTGNVDVETQRVPVADIGGDIDEDYSASVSAIIQRRNSSRRQSKRRRRPSSPFGPDGKVDGTSADKTRRRSSAYTNSSADTPVWMEEGSGQEQIFERLKLHEEILSGVKQEPWSLRRKVELVRRAKTYARRNEGALHERLAHNRNTRDVIAQISLVITKKWQYFRREFTNLQIWLVPWEYRIKQIESHFGSAVASYFIFLRWLFWINLVISFTLVAFVAVPEVLTADKDLAGERKIMLEDEVAESKRLTTLWQFEGVLRYSPFFYGWYTNRDSGSSYRLPLAYFVTNLIAYAYSFVAILRKMAENSRMSKLTEKEDECAFSWKLFTGWDFMIGNPETAHNRTAGIVLGFKEALLEEAEKQKDERNWKIICARVFVNAAVMSLLALSAYAVIKVVARSAQNETQTDWWSQNEITIVMSIISYAFPIFFEILGFLESYHPRKQLRMQLARIMALNLLNLYSLIIALFDKIKDMEHEINRLKPANATCKRKLVECPNDQKSSRSVAALASLSLILLNNSTQMPIDNINTRKTEMLSPPNVDEFSGYESITNIFDDLYDDNLYGDGDYPNVDYDYYGHVNISDNVTIYNYSTNGDQTISTEINLYNISSFFENNTSVSFNENFNETTESFSNETTESDSSFTIEQIDKAEINKSETQSRDNWTFTEESFNETAVNEIEKTTRYDENENFGKIEIGEKTRFSSTDENSFYINQNWDVTVGDKETTIKNDENAIYPNKNFDETNLLNFTPETTTVYESTITHIFNANNFTEDSFSSTTTSFTEINSEDTFTVTTLSSSTAEIPKMTTSGHRRVLPLTESNYVVRCYEKVCKSLKPADMLPSVISLKRLPSKTRKKLRRLCWETMFGQELAKLTVMDLALTILSTLTVDFFRAIFVRFMNNCWCWDLEKRFPQYGDFKIAENILHLVNNQGMVWMGMFFGPGLTALNLLKLGILMYLRSWAVLTCNVPHEVVFRASRSNNFYFALLLTMLFLCVLPVGYAIVWVEPSWHCGPFSGYPTIYNLATDSLKNSLPDIVRKCLEYIASPGIIIPLIVLMTLIIFYLVSLAGSLREANNDLKMQLRHERTEERRKLFKIAEKRQEVSEAPFARWKKILPALPSNSKIPRVPVPRGDSRAITIEIESPIAEVISTENGLMNSERIENLVEEENGSCESKSIQPAKYANREEKPRSISAVSNDQLQVRIPDDSEISPDLIPSQQPLSVSTEVHRSNNDEESEEGRLEHEKS